MPIIKAGQTAPLLKDAIVLDLGDLSRQAQVLRAQAQEQARRIVEEAQAQARKIVAAAHGEGFAQGHAQGLEQGRAQGRDEGHRQALEQTRARLDTLDQAWTRTMDQWLNRRDEVDRAARSAVLELALKLAEKIVHRCIQVDASVVVDQVAQAVAHVLGPMDVTVQIHPQDRTVVEEALPGLTARFPQMRHVRLVDEAQIEPGGCVVSFGQGAIDARLETQLRRIVELLLPEGTTAADAHEPPTRPPAPSPAEAQP